MSAVAAALKKKYSLAIEYNGPLEAAHAHIDDDRYDKVNCYAASPLKLPHQVSYEAFLIGIVSIGVVCVGSPKQLI